jgi:hypothetical protein
MATDRDKTDAAGGATYGNHLWLWCSPPCAEGREKLLLGVELRREERLVSHTGACVDRVGAFNDLGEGAFAYLPLLPHIMHDRSRT